MKRTPRTWDAVVVGAGPAGTVAAHGLAEPGGGAARRPGRVPAAEGVRLLPRRTGARRADHSGLSSRLTDLRPAPAQALHLRAWRAEAVVLLPAGVSVSRDRFDAMLVEAAEAEGTRLMSVPVPRSSAANAVGRSTLALEGTRGSHTTVQCRVVIAAVGLGGSFAFESWGVKSPPRITHRRQHGRR